MFVAYFFEGLIIGSLLGLLLRPVADSYIVWRQAKQWERTEGSPDIVHAPEPPLTWNGQDQRARDRRIR